LNLLKSGWKSWLISLILVPLYVFVFEYLRSLGDNGYSFNWFTCIYRIIVYVIAWNLIAAKFKKEKK